MYFLNLGVKGLTVSPNPFTPKLKRDIIPTFLSKLQKAKLAPYCVTFNISSKAAEEF